MNPNFNMSTIPCTIFLWKARFLRTWDYHHESFRIIYFWHGHYFPVYVFFRRHKLKPSCVLSMTNYFCAIFHLTGREKITEQVGATVPSRQKKKLVFSINSDRCFWFAMWGISFMIFISRLCSQPFVLHGTQGIGQQCYSCF